MRVVVISDTHSRRLPPVVVDALAAADVILHAGDVTDASVLVELRRFAPVYAVRGNNDVNMDLPDTRVFDLAGVRVAMVHDSGARAGRERRMRKLFPDADVVVFGHSHIPWNDEGVDGQLLFNPGSPTQRRRQPVATYGILELAAGTVTRHDIVPVA
jgi:putative phosphoesterase